MNNKAYKIKILMHKMISLKSSTLVLFLIILLSLGCTEKVQKPNVVYILTDQWRASAFAYAGDPNVKTPNIDRFAKQAVNFSNAVSVCPVCTPHRAALLTGKFPTSTGMFLNDLYLPSEELCMAEIFKEAGYQTAYLGKWHLDGHGRYNNVEPERRQGFDYWKALECSHNYNKMPYYDQTSPEIKYWDDYSPFAISEEAQNYLSENSSGVNPFLLFISIAGPHFPHNSAPQEYKDLYPESEIQVAPNVPEDLHKKVKTELQGYYAHCTAIDYAIGEIINKMKKLGLMENTVLVFTSDHGEMMGGHGARPKSKQIAWDESTRVPFLIHYPSMGKNMGVQINAPLTTPDILPSLLGLANIEVPNTIEGEDLSQLIKSPNPEVDRAALFMNVCPFGNEYKFEEYRGIRTKQYTYVRSPEKGTMLFDNIKDPYQMDNMIEKTKFVQLQSKLDMKLNNALEKIRDNDFKSREYYLNKWNLKLNKGKVIDYGSFNKGEGVVQSPNQ